MSEHEHPPEHFEEGEEAPPPGVRVMAKLRWLLLVAMAVIASLAIYSYLAPLFGQTPAGQAAKTKYHCPMHPQIVRDTPGTCPICQMDLVPMKAAAAKPAGSSGRAVPPPASSSAPAKPAAKYHCPMHPEITSDGPGRCPICKMSLEAVDGPENKALPPPEGTTLITLELDRLQAIGVRTAPVERIRATDTLRVTATVEAPEQGRAEVHARAEGFVEALAVKQIGVKVKAGQLLAAIYSPAIYQAEQELLTMSRWPADPRNRAGLASPPLEAAKRRLELLGVGRGGIDRLLASGQPSRAIGISSPIAGYVAQKHVVLGSRVTPEMTLFEIVDLGKVYVVARVYPHQLAAIKVGDEGRLVLRDTRTRSAPVPLRGALTGTDVPLRGALTGTDVLGDEALGAKVDVIEPDVDPVTRTTRVRFHVDNPELRLRPGQYGTVEFEAKAGETLSVPLDAVIDTGKSTYVFVAHDGGRFEPRAVELGETLDDRYLLRAGLREGERVVAAATFLIDSESRMQASFAAAPTAGAGAGIPKPGK